MGRALQGSSYVIEWVKRVSPLPAQRSQARCVCVEHACRRCHRLQARGVRGPRSVAAAVRAAGMSFGGGQQPKGLPLLRGSRGRLAPTLQVSVRIATSRILRLALLWGFQALGRPSPDMTIMMIVYLDKAPSSV